MAVNGGADRVALARDEAINHIFGSGLKLAAIIGRPDINEDLAQQLADVIEELDMAVNAMRQAAFVADGDPRADPPAQPAASAVEPDRTALVRVAQAAERRRLIRVADDAAFAYAMCGHDFYRVGDNSLWAHESEDLLLSARSGRPLARRTDDVFYDIETNVPLYYEDDRSGPLPVQSCGGSPAATPESFSNPPILGDAVG